MRVTYVLPRCNISKNRKNCKPYKRFTLNCDNTNKINFKDGGLLGAYDRMAAVRLVMCVLSVFNMFSILI